MRPKSACGRKGNKSSVCESRTFGEESLDLLDVSAGFGKRWHATVTRDIAWTGVVTGQRKLDVAVVLCQQLFQVLRASHDVLAGVERVLNPQLGLQRRHELHEPLRAHG